MADALAATAVRPSDRPSPCRRHRRRARAGRVRRRARGAVPGGPSLAVGAPSQVGARRPRDGRRRRRHRRRSLAPRLSDPAPNWVGQRSLERPEAHPVDGTPEAQGAVRVHGRSTVWGRGPATVGAASPQARSRGYGNGRLPALHRRRVRGRSVGGDVRDLRARHQRPSTRRSPRPAVTMPSAPSRPPARRSTRARGPRCPAPSVARS